MFYKPFFGKKTHTHTTSPINASDIKKTKKIIFLFIKKIIFLHVTCVRVIAQYLRVSVRVFAAFLRVKLSYYKSVPFSAKHSDRSASTHHHINI